MITEKHLKLLKNFIVKFRILFLILLFNPILVLADEVILVTTEKTLYKGIQIELVSIGSSGSIYLKVNNIPLTLSLGKEKMFLDVNFTLLETTENVAKLSLSQNVACLIDEDCNDNLPCTQDICSILKECINKKINGCIKNNKCLSNGTISDIDGVAYYCSNNFEWQKGKTFNEQCNGNYECLSNFCINNKCTEKHKDTKMAFRWLVIVFGIILLIKGLFMHLYPEKVKNLLREFSYQKSGRLKILGILFTIIGILLIVWALS